MSTSRLWTGTRSAILAKILFVAVQQNQLAHQTTGFAEKMVAVTLATQTTKDVKRNVALPSVHPNCLVHIEWATKEASLLLMTTGLRLMTPVESGRPHQAATRSNLWRLGLHQRTSLSLVVTTTCLHAESLLRADIKATSSGPTGFPENQTMGRSQSSPCPTLSSGAKKMMVGSATTTVEDKIMPGANQIPEKATMR